MFSSLSIRDWEEITLRFVFFKSFVGDFICVSDLTSVANYLTKDAIFTSVRRGVFRLDPPIWNLLSLLIFSKGKRDNVFKSIITQLVISGSAYGWFNVKRAGATIVPLTCKADYVVVVLPTNLKQHLSSGKILSGSKKASLLITYYLKLLVAFRLNDSDDCSYISECCC